MRVRSRSFRGISSVTASFVALLLPISGNSQLSSPALADDKVVSTFEVLEIRGDEGSKVGGTWVNVGVPLALGDLEEGAELQVQGALYTQTDVKTRWPDGSARFVALTALVPDVGAYPVVVASRSAANRPAGKKNASPQPVQISLKPAVEPMSLRAAGEYSLADIFITVFPQGGGDPQEYGVQISEPPPFDERIWYRYPPAVGNIYAAEWRVESAFRAMSGPNQGAEHFLTAAVDVQVFWDQNGKKQVGLDVTIENLREDHPEADMVWYTLRIKRGDQTLFAPEEGYGHPYLTRFRAFKGAFDLSSETWRPTSTAIVRWDTESAIRARALPEFRDDIINQVDYPVGPGFRPFGPGALDSFMPNHSGRPELAPYPDWTARYLVHKNRTQKEFVLAHGDLAGSWPVHVRGRDGSMVSIVERPNFWLDLPLNRGEDQPRGNLGAVGPLLPDNAHQPSLAYVPYLMTGDRYYADEMAFWANFCILATAPCGREGPLGLLQANETRGFAWTLRNLADAAAWIPDSHPMKGYFIGKVQNNLAWLDAHVAANTGPLGVAWHGPGGNEYFDPPPARHAWQSAAQNNYLAWAVDHANKQGFRGGEAFKLQMAHYNIALLDNPATRDGAAPYNTPIGDRVPPGSDNIVWYTRLEQTYRGPVQYAGYYGVDCRLMCLIGMENGISGAREGRDYLDRIMMVEDPFQELLRGGWYAMPER